MRKLWAIVAVVGALAVVPMMTALAGGKGAVKSDLYVAEWGGPGNMSSVIVEPRVDVGDVIANTTASGKLLVTVKIKGGAPSADWVVRFIGSGLASPPLDTPLTTNGSGQGTLQASVPIPETASDALTFSVGVRDGERGLSDHTYRSEPITVPLK